MAEHPPADAVSQTSTTETTTVASAMHPTRTTTVETVQAQRTTAGFLQDNEGHNSAMRLMSFIALATGVLFGLITLYHPGSEASPNGLYLTTLAFVCAFCPQALQKFVELRYPSRQP